MIAGGSALTVAEAPRLRDVILAAAEAENVELDLAGAAEIDLAGFQLIFAAQRDWSAKGRRFTVKDSPAGIWKRTLDTLGLDPARNPQVGPPGKGANT